jgi:hypothetical protein
LSSDKGEPTVALQSFDKEWRRRRMEAYQQFEKEEEEWQ